MAIDRACDQDSRAVANQKSKIKNSIVCLLEGDQFLVREKFKGKRCKCPNG